MAIRVSFFALRSNERSKLIDWLFSSGRVVEMHTFLVTLLQQFDFALPDNGQEVMPIRQGAMTPVVVGEEYKGPQMPLKVTVLGNK